MFFGSVFNQSLATFDTSKVTDMEAMFANNTVFNQPLSTFDTSLVTNMQSMFQAASLFNQNISNWCVPLIASKPSSFDISGNAGFTNNAAKQPTWGTCPVLVNGLCG
jgi:surface protein